MSINGGQPAMLLRLDHAKLEHLCVALGRFACQAINGFWCQVYRVFCNVKLWSCIKVNKQMTLNFLDGGAIFRV